MAGPFPLVVAVIDDEADLRDALCDCLALEGLTPLAFASGEAALKEIDPHFPGIVLTDLRMPGIDGQGVFTRLAELDSDLPVIVLTGHGDLDTAVDLMRRGAYDFISKPFVPEMLLQSVRRALEKRGLVLENRKLVAEAVQGSDQLVAGESPIAGRLREAIRLLAATGLSVLISGEPGTGKSLIAELIHRKGPNGHRQAVTIDCSALPLDHAESILFGHASGAFQGASMPRTGQLLRADGATLILDRADRLPLALQLGIRRFMETGTMHPVGANQGVKVSTRIIATADPSIEAAVQDGRFDRSLYDLLGGYRIDLPPLRDRRQDIALLFRAFLTDAARDAGRDLPMISPAVWRRLETHGWPGNARELKGFAASVALGLGALELKSQPVVRPDATGLKTALAEYEEALIRESLEQHRGDIARTIAALELPRKTFYDRAARYGIDPADYRDPLRRSGALRR